MPTPMFKVLAQSMRLGQPPDPTSAIRVLVEVVEKQQAELEDLRSKLSIAASRLAYAEGRLAHLLEAGPGGEAAGAPPSAPARSQPPRSQPPRAPEPQRGSQRPPPPPIPAPPPIPKAPRAPSVTPQVAPHVAGPRPLEAPSIVDTGFDEFNHTLVIHKRDVERAARAEAPFPLAPASERPRATTAEGTPFQPPPAPEPGSPASERGRSYPPPSPGYLQEAGVVQERGYQQQGYQEQGYQEQGFQEQGFQQQGYQQQGYQEQGYQEQGHREEQGYQQQAAASASRGSAPAEPGPDSAARFQEVEDDATVGMADSPLVDLAADEGDGSTVTDRVAREALAAFAELEARHRRGPRGG